MFSALRVPAAAAAAATAARRCCVAKRSIIFALPSSDSNVNGNAKADAYTSALSQQQQRGFATAKGSGDDGSSAVPSSEELAARAVEGLRAGTSSSHQGLIKIPRGE
jgi:hypothetical protein